MLSITALKMIHTEDTEQNEAPEYIYQINSKKLF